MARDGLVGLLFGGKLALYFELFGFDCLQWDTEVLLFCVCVDFNVCCMSLFYCDWFVY